MSNTSRSSIVSERKCINSNITTLPRLSFLYQQEDFERNVSFVAMPRKIVANRFRRIFRIKLD